MTQIKLISSDNIEFVIEKELAVQSKTLRMLIASNSNFVEYQADKINLPIKGKQLERVVEFLKYKAQHRNVEDFVIKDEETIDLLDVAAYLRM